MKHCANDLMGQLCLCKTTKYTVILIDNNAISMSFTISMLTEIFKKTTEEAINITIKAHNEGKSIVGVYSYEVARARIALMDKKATEHNYPPTTRMEYYQ